MQNPGITTHHGQYEPMWKILPIKKLENFMKIGSVGTKLSPLY